MKSASVTASTKCWEGDYRVLLRAETLRELFTPFGSVARRQIVLNRIVDRAAADGLAQKLCADGVLDAYTWAEDCWPELSARLRVPTTWFGSAWPYAVPELSELALASTPVVAHVAGDVRLEPGEPWLPRALAVLPEACAVSPVSPSRIELVRPEASNAFSGWVRNRDFSDQCFVARAADLLTPEVVRATHPAAGRYPKPGGALTFEARVGAWMRSTGQVRFIDVRRAYIHPVGGIEGDSYQGLAGPAEELPQPPEHCSAYPPESSVDVTAVVAARNAERTIPWTLASLRWAREVIVIDQASGDRTAEIAAAYGATLRPWPVATIAGPAVLPQVARDVEGWLLYIDAREIVPPALARAFAETVEADDIDAIAVGLRRHVLGHLEPASASLPAQIRLVRPSRAAFRSGKEALHVAITLQPGGRSRTLTVDDDLAIVHFGPADLHDYVAQANDMTSLAARGTEVPGNRSARRAAKRLVQALLADGEWRHGSAGWRRAVLVAAERWLLNEKAWELVGGGRAVAFTRYDEVALRILTDRE